MCDHPRDRWIGTASGIVCGLCGAPVGAAKPAPVKVAEPKEEKAEPVKKAEPKKAETKKGGAKGVKSK